MPFQGVSANVEVSLFLARAFRIHRFTLAHVMSAEIRRREHDIIRLFDPTRQYLSCDEAADILSAALRLRGFSHEVVIGYTRHNESHAWIRANGRDLDPTNQGTFRGEVVERWPSDEDNNRNRGGDHVDPAMVAGLAFGYKSRSQIARVVSEGWAASHLYCFNCDCSKLRAHRAGKAVEDFHCPGCTATYQLKAKAHRIGNTIANSAWEPKVAAIRANKPPNYVILAYDPDSWQARNAFVIPGAFVTEAVVEKRPPLRRGARRSGWVGSNINLRAIPPQGKIPILDEGTPVPPYIVRHAFRRATSLLTMTSASRAWFAEVLWALDHLQKAPGDRVNLQGLYTVVPTLALRHPWNSHIKPKLRQQMQVAVARGYVKRVKPGIYEVQRLI